MYLIRWELGSNKNALLICLHSFSQPPGKLNLCLLKDRNLYIVFEKY